MCKNEHAGRVYDAASSLKLWSLAVCRGTDEGLVLRVYYVTLPRLSVVTVSPGAARFQGAAVSSGCDASLHPCTLIFTANTLPLDCNHDSDSARPDGGCCSCFIKGSFFYRSWSSACESKQSTDGVGRSVCVCLPLGSQGGSLRGWPGGMWGEDPEISIEALHNQSLGPEVLQGRARRRYLHVGKWNVRMMFSE